MGLPDGEEITTLAFFVLTQYWRVTDRQTDTLLSQRPALAYSVTRIKMEAQLSLTNPRDAKIVKNWCN